MDKIANMIISIKNGGSAGHDSIAVPFSELKKTIAKALLDYDYIAGYAQESSQSGGGSQLRIDLKYLEGGKPRISDVKRISKPSRRMYMGVRDIFPVRHGQGTIILSTPKGILSGEDARRQRVGGEPLFEIW